MDAKKTDGLKPCPFCGKDSTVVLTEHDVNWFSIKCDVCGSSWEDYTFEETARKWNRRPVEDELMARIAQLDSIEQGRDKL